MKRHNTLRGAIKWAYLMNWSRQGFSALFSLFLAAILGPKAYGVIAIAMIYILFIQMLLDQGLLAALIQRKDLKVEHLDSAFWAVLVASLGLTFVSIDLSRWWAVVNHSDILVQVIGVLSVCIVIEGLSIVQRALFQRAMDFRSLSLAAALSVVIGGIVGVVMALRGFGIWSLVGQQISQNLIALFTLWKLSDWRPRWRFSIRAFRELLGFSSANFLAKLGVFVTTQADSLLVGVFFGPVAVGLYRLAERMMNTVLNLVSSSLQTVSFPEFSRLQDNPEELRRSVLTCIRISAIGTFPALAGLAVTSNLVFAAMGPKWADSADVLKLFCLAGMIYVVGQFVGPLLQAVGKPHYLAVLQWSQSAVGLSLAALVAFHLRKATVWSQIMGFAGVRLTMSLVVGMLMLLVILPRLSRISCKEFIQTVAPALASAGAVVGLVLLLKWSGWINAWSPMHRLLTAVFLGATMGITTLYALDDVVRPVVNGRVRKILMWRKGSEAPKEKAGTVIGRVWVDPK